jgi:hypothetical protein
MAAPKPKFNTEELQRLIEDYFNESPDRPTVTGLAHYLGFESRQSLYDYKDRESSSYTIKRAILKIEQKHEENLFSNNATGSIFWLKNRDWTDKQAIDHTTKGESIVKPDLSKLTDAELRNLVELQRKSGIEQA